MTSRYELTISKNYVKDWTYLEGVREFFQNAIDESMSNPDHAMHYQYDSVTNTLVIRNDNCKLNVNSLLLGESSKGNGSYIGSFGEGYKIGILVLLRNNKGVTIENAKDLWSTSIVKSRRYKSEIPIVLVTKNHNKSNKDLTVSISGITPDEFDEISNNVLYIKDKNHTLNKIKTDYGDLLTDESERGRVYVGGLFVCNDFELKYGYNINPSVISLNRDRNMISSFDLIWNTSRIIAEAFRNDNSKLLDSLKSKDAKYIETALSASDKERLSEYFSEKYKGAVPVSTQEEYNYFQRKNMNPIIVKENVKSIIISSNKYSQCSDMYKIDNSLYNVLSSIVRDLEPFIKDNGKNKLKELSEIISEYKDNLSEIDYVNKED